ncbi:hypothetical protein [Arenimonas composti]|uniref:Uncharacterized protein n=1 Tax=Arenimonas composti TR7-09 = DSM 18010 TaxID=1121013 RepID=A0A091B7S2_9GAMM|nr:hypothetical protein [Arenimonas composti]KFN48718.1 hypothetical protein P873_13760 [Arenimonas composti TR7-09 = DSM 18010]
MCLAVYLASTIAVPRERHGDPALPSVHLRRVGDDDPIRRQVLLPHVYYVASHQGCGCGFLKEPGDDIASKQANRVQLAQLIRDMQDAGARLEVFACWEGEQGEPAEVTETRTADEIAAEDFRILESHHITLATELVSCRPR